MADVPVYSVATGELMPFKVEESRVKFFDKITTVAPAKARSTKEETPATTPTAPSVGETPKE